MKLLEELEKQIKSVGPLRKAWFTTFNLSFDLLETWILPTLVGCDIPKNAAGYEAVQSLLFGAGNGSKPIDIRVFCDERTLRTSVRKRTTVPVHGIDFRRADLLDAEKKFSKGFFHPKVIYLEGEKGAVIGAGSANLSIDAWSRNRECFHFEPLQDSTNIEEVLRFFQRLHAWAGIDAPASIEVTTRGSSKPDWAFVSSLSKVSFLDRLLGSDATGQDLTVWSPYFSDDLPGLFARMKENERSLAKVRLVPDIKDWKVSGGGKMRISQASVEALLGQGHEFLLDIPFLNSNPETPRFSHAKVWHTPHRIGIGSWNLSKPALGLGDKANVEAGFVLERTAEITSLEPMKNPSVFAMSAEELKEESAGLEALTLPEVAIRVAFDWKDCSWSWVYAELGQELSNVILRIPGIEPIALDAQLEGFCEGGTAPLKQRFVSVEFLRDTVRGSQAVWVEERNAQERPDGGFESLDSLMTGLLQGSPAKSLEGDRFLLSSEEKEGDEDILGDVPRTGSTISYFRMFAAMRQARLRFHPEDVQNADVLRRRIRVEPGCLRELHAKILEHCSKTEEKFPAGMSQTARWFWFHELRLVLEEAEKRLKEFSSESSVKAEIDAMLKEVEVLASPITPDGKLLDIIHKAVGGTP